ncbi:putative bifunctional diguanylate cyclase/phosphodiesterase [Bacterioplanes sanyensis]|uniref:putative bifunctional diguanylate cyclase/phosphodiesterase n=1 Tax=Bacterioplanes sanyensis TaxID=1249553 RepID=UPI001E32E2DF|nr:EAL domain-containing protein [Bacterioplanes sanyensis]
MRRNIWSLFVFIVLGGLVLLAAIVGYGWHAQLDENLRTYSNRAELMGETVRSVLAAEEMLLDILGDELLDAPDALQGSRPVPLLDRLLEVNPVLVGFGLASPDGEFLQASSNALGSNQPNLLQHPDTRDSFLRALHSRHMVLGRTYLMPSLQRWIIPLRKALRDDRGNVVAVMTSGIDLSTASDLFQQRLSDQDRTWILRTHDNYLQFTTSAGGSNNYAQPLETAVVRAIERALQQDNGVDLATVRMGKGAWGYRLHRDGEPVLGAAMFLPIYDLWVFTETPEQPLRTVFLGRVAIYAALYGVVVLVLFALFRAIARAEDLQRQQLFFTANHDGLTNLPNRNYLLEHVHGWMDEDRGFFVMFIDMDNFKGVNDSFGHDCGDQVLIELSHRLQRHVEDGEVLARLGGDEFILLLTTTDQDRVRQRANAIIDSVSRDYTVYGFNFQLGASIGVARYPLHGRSMNDLLRAADIAMHEAKKARNSVHFYHDEMESGYLRKIRIEQRLRSALSGGHLFMVYQPQVSHDGRMLGVEALIRWKDDELGFVPPDEFIGVAESTGLMPAIGEFVVSTAMREMTLLQQHLGERFDIAINISVKQFLQAGFAEGVREQISHYRLRPELVTLEITESVFIEDLQMVLPILNELHDMGVRISLDDFGTGFSSLSVLRLLPIDELKIDKSFIDDIRTDQTAHKMAQSVIAIGKNYGMSVLAEGVETADQKELLMADGCDRYQGYHFARPMPAAELAVFIRESPAIYL